MTPRLETSSRWTLPPPRNIVLFAYAISHPFELPYLDADMVIRDLLLESRLFLSRDLSFAIHDVAIVPGALQIYIQLDTVAAFLPTHDSLGDIMFSGSALWAADKVAGGSLSKLGYHLVNNFVEHLNLRSDQLIDRSTGKTETRSVDILVTQYTENQDMTIQITNIEKMAERTAMNIGKQRGCRVAIREGGRLSVDGFIYFMIL
jgi:hypothetical protein